MVTFTVYLLWAMLTIVTQYSSFLVTVSLVYFADQVFYFHEFRVLKTIAQSRNANFPQIHLFDCNLRNVKPTQKWKTRNCNHSKLYSIMWPIFLACWFAEWLKSRNIFSSLMWKCFHDCVTVFTSCLQFEKGVLQDLENTGEGLVVSETFRAFGQVRKIQYHTLSAPFSDINWFEKILLSKILF